MLTTGQMKAVASTLAQSDELRQATDAELATLIELIAAVGYGMAVLIEHMWSVKAKADGGVDLTTIAT